MQKSAQVSKPHRIDFESADKIERKGRHRPSIRKGDAMLYQYLKPNERRGPNKYRHGDFVLYDDKPEPDGEEQKRLRAIWKAGEPGAVRGTCAYCGREFYQEKYKGAADKYCSERCRNDAYMERRRIRHDLTRQKVCTVCGTLYDATRTDSKYCSPACKQAAYRKRREKSLCQN